MAGRQKTAQVLIANVRALMRANGMTVKALAAKSGVSERHIKYVFSGERTPTVDVADALAKPFGIKGWQLMMPNLPADIAKSGQLDQLIDRYAKSNEQGRDYIDRVAEKEAKYGNR